MVQKHKNNNKKTPRHPKRSQVWIDQPLYERVETHCELISPPSKPTRLINEAIRVYLGLHEKRQESVDLLAATPSEQRLLVRFLAALRAGTWDEVFLPFLERLPDEFVRTALDSSKPKSE